MNSKQSYTIADFTGDESSLPGAPDHFKPGLIVNPEADCSELLSGSIHRLGNALDLFWLCLERANAVGDSHMEGALFTMARLCTEARALNIQAIEQASPTKAPVTTIKKVREVPG